MDEDFRKLLQETAGMRLVLVHLLARQPRAELEAISEAINKELAPWAELQGLQGEEAFAPYREAIDDLIADAVKRANREG